MYKSSKGTKEHTFLQKRCEKYEDIVFFLLDLCFPWLPSQGGRRGRRRTTPGLAKKTFSPILCMDTLGRRRGSREQVSKFTWSTGFLILTEGSLSRRQPRTTQVKNISCEKYSFIYYLFWLLWQVKVLRSPDSCPAVPPGTCAWGTSRHPGWGPPPSGEKKEKVRSE